MARLAQWCDDATAASQAQGGPAYRFAYVDQDGFDRHPPGSLAELATMFREYHPTTVSGLTDSTEP
jgi:type III restriction enzyme